MKSDTFCFDACQWQGRRSDTYRANTYKNLVSYMARISVIAGDVLALSVTWWKTLGIVREATRLKIKVPLGMVLIREGECSAHYSAYYLLFFDVTPTVGTLLSL